ncbi:Putative protein of unknown function [Podospora comata]|uniref:Uncharacterized protein n=1 Tax=Podospora comata TaxID=48703 RepID=A0ABY6SC56_PODCO|nr:Putative protein of unknown function [Podospora comata]
MQTSLPPLDLLMIWHSFMLNPYLYKDWARAVRPSGATDCCLHWELLLETTNRSLPGYQTAKYDLVAAVGRQADFALTITRFAWIHKPYSDSIFRRAIARYSSFLRLFHAGLVTVVPTLDIDLVWHTHQLSPAVYFQFSKSVTNGRFINHNDHLEQKAISSRFEQAKQLYKRHFGEKYVLCNSWFCEAARLKPDGVLQKAELLVVQRLIRNSSLLLPVKLDIAECSCHNRELCDDSPYQEPGPEGGCGGCGGCAGGGSRCVAAYNTT